MKQIDEKALLLAVGNVGDDLLQRAEKPVVARSGFTHWGALAACFCLIAVLAIPHLMDSFRMGSDSNASENSMSMAEDVYDAEEREEYNGIGTGKSEPEAAQDVDGTQEVQMDGVDCLALLGINSAQDIFEIRIGDIAADQSAGSQETVGKKDLREDAAARFCAMLENASVIEAEMDAEKLDFSTPITVTLQSGDVVEGGYDEAAAVLALEGYHFYGVEISDLY